MIQNIVPLAYDSLGVIGFRPESKNMRVLTAAEFAGNKVEMLEALRRELYEKDGVVGTSEKARKLLKE